MGEMGVLSNKEKGIMAGQQSVIPYQQGITTLEANVNLSQQALFSTPKWYFSREEIEDCSPSRKDCIDLEMESKLRKMYSSFLRELGMKLKLPQVTIACGILLCHRFYMRQSHAKNDWQTIATVSMFVACKIEDVPQLLRNVIVVAYEILYKWDPSSAKRVRQRDFYDKQKELILIGERLLLGTIAFDLDVQLPYPPLVRALKKLNILPNLAKVAWNFVNDWLCTTLCLQFKPHYIAAGSLYLAAEVQKFKLPEEKGNVWWMEFEVSSKKLKEVIRQMIKVLKEDEKLTPPPKSKKIGNQSSVSVGKQSTDSPESCISIGPVAESHSCNKSMVDTVGIGKSLASGDMYVGNPTCSISAGTADKDCDVESQPKTGGSDLVSDNKVVSPHHTAVKECDMESRPKTGCCDSVSGNKVIPPHYTAVEDCGMESRPKTGGSDSLSGNKVLSPHHIAVKDCDMESQPKTGGSDSFSGNKVISSNNMYNKIDASRIREALKRKRSIQVAKKEVVEVMDADIGSEAWIERELENGVQLE